MLSLISVAVSLFVIRLTWYRVRKSNELKMTLVTNVHPHLVEKVIGYMCYVTYFIMTGYKIYTRRVIFMHNPCHYVLLLSAILLTTKKT